MNNGFLRAAAANPVVEVADPARNATHIIEIAAKANKEGVELLVFPELSITGCTCGDLFLQKTLIDGAKNALRTIADATKDYAMFLFVGLPVRHGGKLFNACAVLRGGELLGVVPKTHVPACGDRNEARYFATPGKDTDVIYLDEMYCAFGQRTFRITANVSVGVEIGEDLWAAVPPSCNSGALVTVHPSATCETADKADVRRMLVQSQSLKTATGYVHADAGRGESTADAVYAGHAVIAENGKVLAENAPFEQNELTVADIDTDRLLFERARTDIILPSLDNGVACFDECVLPEWKGAIRRTVCKLPYVPQGDTADAQAERILTAQAEGLIKRMEHTGLHKPVLGVSGGLDSALALLVCMRALDRALLPRKNLVALSMPGLGTSEQTAGNAAALSEAAGAECRTVDICESVNRHLQEIGHPLDEHDAAFENAQARMRTLVLMDIANREGGLVVGTGDLSEAALGWCTYNGDHMSMYGVNASVPKTLVKFLVAYEAKRLGGRLGETLLRVLKTDISPELLPAKSGKIAQKTEDAIGSFEQNDFFMYYAVQCGCTPQKTLLYAAAAFGGKPSAYESALARFYKRFFASQFKRSCAPDGATVGFSFSPRGAWNMPSDASVRLWTESIEKTAKGI